MCDNKIIIIIREEKEVKIDMNKKQQKKQKKQKRRKC